MGYKFSVQKVSILPKKKNSIADKKERHEV